MDIAELLTKSMGTRFWLPCGANHQLALGLPDKESSRIRPHVTVFDDGLEFVPVEPSGVTVGILPLEGNDFHWTGLPQQSLTFCPLPQGQ